MMNQTASVTRRPSGSTATAGCCPMLVHPQFFVNTFSAQTPLAPPPPPPPANAGQQCLIGAQANQLTISATTTAPTTNAPRAGQPNATATNGTASANQHHHHHHHHHLASNGSSQQQAQQVSNRQDHTNYNTSISAQTARLPLQHLLASRHSASNCMALAAALATASFQQQQRLHQEHQQQQQQQQTNHHLQHPTPINHSQQQSTNSSGNTAPQAANTTTTNHVPLLNFNSYNAAQPFLNMAAPPPLAAHLNLSLNHHQTQQAPTNASNHSSNTNFAAPVHSSSGNQLSQQANHVPLATNTSLNSAANQQNNYRSAPHQQAAPTHQPTPIGQGAGRNIASEDALSSIFNEQVQAILLNQLFANHQFAPPINPTAPINTARHITPPPPNQASTTMPAQQAPQSQQQQPPAPVEPSTEQAQPGPFQPVSQTTAQPRIAQGPPLDTYSSSAAHQAAAFQQQQQQQQLSVPVNNQINNQQPQPTEPVPLQTQQPQSIPPPIPFYSFPQMEQALALLANPNNFFSHVFNIYLQGGMRTEPHHTHHHHHPHHYHHHLHGSHHHHHHHHGPNGQNNGQDDTMLMSESKPRGLTRSEIDSLTPYVQTNEKDPRTCVICLSKFELKSKIRPLPCNHAFHAKCVDKWLRANRTCPICRRDALKTYGGKIKRI